MTQPSPAVEQLLNLADRAERGPLTGDEATRLRDGITRLEQLHEAHLRVEARLAREEMAANQRAEKAEAERNALIDERDKLDRRLTTMTDVARSNRRHVRAIVPELEAATQRAERAEAVAREILRHFIHKGHPGEPCLQTGWISIRTVEKWRAALDEHQEQQP